MLHVSPIRFTVAEAVQRLMQTLPSTGQTSLRKLTAGVHERLDVIVQFLALLEMYKQNYIELDQAERFGDIQITWTGIGPEVGDTETDAYEG